jgi:hypothetical protein
MNENKSRELNFQKTTDDYELLFHLTYTTTTFELECMINILTHILPHTQLVIPTYYGEWDLTIYDDECKVSGNHTTRSEDCMKHCTKHCTKHYTTLESRRMTSGTHDKDAVCMSNPFVWVRIDHLTTTPKLSGCLPDLPHMKPLHFENANCIPFNPISHQPLRKIGLGFYHKNTYAKWYVCSDIPKDALDPLTPGGVVNIILHVPHTLIVLKENHEDYIQIDIIRHDDHHNTPSMIFGTFDLSPVVWGDILKEVMKSRGTEKMRQVFKFITKIGAAKSVMFDLGQNHPDIISQL